MSARKKVLLDIFGHPATLLPIVAGSACFILSWAVGWNSLFSLGGIFGWLGGIGTAATRLILAGPDELLAKQRQYEHESKLEEENRKLDKLDAKLRTDKDKRTHRCLREIRYLYDTLKEDVAEGKISSSGYKFLETVESLFEACVSLLEDSYDLYETYRDMKRNSPARKSLREQRENKIKQCVETTEHLRQAIKQFHEVRGKRKIRNIKQLRSELDRQIEIARKVGSTVDSIDLNHEFEDFIREG